MIITTSCQFSSVQQDGEYTHTCTVCGNVIKSKNQNVFYPCKKSENKRSHSLPKSTRGSGDFLHDFIARWIGAKPTWSCQCGQRIGQMNAWGPAGCRENLETIVDWLAEEAAKRKWWKYTAKMPFARTALKQIILHCIRQAENEAENRNPEMDYAFCNTATESLPADEMCKVIDAAPPGPWPKDWANWENTKEAHRILARRFADKLREGIRDWGLGIGGHDGESNPQSLIPNPSLNRGIVIAGGGPKYFPGVWVCVKLLRHFGCTLPIQLWHLGPDECDPYMRRLLQPMGVECVDARQVERERHPCRILCGWELKPFSVLYSPFAEVLFLDADNGVVRDPTYLFDRPEYARHGAAFWPDYSHWMLKPDIWRIFGMDDRREPAFESGQFIVNKRLCSRELRMALWYAEHSDFTFSHVYGDKECFHLGWRRLGSDYAMPARPPGWNIHTIVQYGFDNEIVFQHRCQDKWARSGNRRNDSLANEQLCFDLVEELFKQWTGKLWHNPRPTEAEQATIDSLTGRRFLYRRVGHDERPLILGPGGRVDEGAAECEVRWDVNQVDGEPVLTISREDRPTCHLRRNGDGTWRGKWLEFERMPVELLRD
jgi:hypothetical protein